MNAILVFLQPKLALLGFKLEISAARITPDVAQAKRGKVPIPSGLLSGIKGGVTLKSTADKPKN